MNLKESDFVEHLFISSTHDYVLFFSSKGKVYRLKVHELPVGSRHARGTAVVNLLPFEQDERIAAVITTREFSADEYLLFATHPDTVERLAAAREYELGPDQVRPPSLLTAVQRFGPAGCRKSRSRPPAHSDGVRMTIVWPEPRARGESGMTIQ